MRKIFSLLLTILSPTIIIGLTQPLERIIAVVFNGEYLSKEAREKMLAEVEALAKTK